MAYNNSFHMPAARDAAKTVPISPTSKGSWSEASKEGPHDNLGLKTLYDPRGNGYGPEEPDFDIVAVHGLLERPDETWTWPSQVGDGSPDNYSSNQRHGFTDRVRDALLFSNEALEKTGSRQARIQQKEELGEGSKKSRRRKKHRKVNWLADENMLPKSFPHARIMRFDYGRKPRSHSLEIRMEVAKRLLNALAKDRKDSLRFPPRPILFIGHSFGGIVIQTALVLAEQEKQATYVPRSNDDFVDRLSQREVRAEILNATVGVIFLATPFKITKSIRERWRSVGVEVLSGPALRNPNSVPSMPEQSEQLVSPNTESNNSPDDFNSAFLETAQEEQYRLACFYEKHQGSSRTQIVTTFLDEDSSTLPGYPKVPLMTNHTGMCKFSGQHDRSYRVVVDAIKGFLAFAPTRQLWKAVEVGRIRSVEMMLDLGADPDLQDIEGESALHKAVRSRQNAAQVIEALMARGANIHLKDSNQKTALSLAEAACRDDIAKLLRRHGATLQFWDMRKAGKQYPLNRIYMDGPSHSSNAERRWDLESLDLNSEMACCHSVLSITHFSSSGGGPLDRYRVKASVFDGLYDDNLSHEILHNSLLKYQKEHKMTVQGSSFTWYHLPANNMAWIEKLFTRIFKTWVENDVDQAQRSLRLLSGEQHKLTNSNFLYMRPDCRPVELKFRGQANDSKAPELEAEKKIALKLFSMVPAKDGLTQMKMPYLHYEKSTTQAGMRKNMEQSTASYDRQAVFKEKPIETIVGPLTLSRQSTGDISSSSSNVEPDTDLEPESNPDPESKSDTGVFGDFISDCINDPPEPYLIGGYLNKDPPLHMRRSLDQFYSISKLDELIGYLDMDQVLYKHFEKKMRKRKRVQKTWPSESWETETVHSEATSSELSDDGNKLSQAFKELVQKWDKETRKPQDYPIVIVDQLWLWLVDGDTIITSFPQGSEPSPNGILERIEEKLKGSEVKVIGDLAGLIIDECAGFLDRCRAPENVAILDIYDETISDAMKQQVEFFDRFTEMVLMSAVKEEYHNLKKAGKHHDMEDELLDFDKGRKFLSSNFDQSTLSIIEEAELLREIRDAKEELNIIKRILEQQDRVINQGFKVMASRPINNDAIKKFNGGSEALTPPLLPVPLIECRHNHERNADMISVTIQNSWRSVRSMLERADEVCDGLKTLLDLKQKEINVQEARATRQIAQGNEKQSKIILIFTIVTIIFMPLSFLASFFALNVDRFPRSLDGGVEFGLPWVAGLIFGVTAAFVVPFVIGAFFFVAPGGREQARNWLRHLLKLIGYPFRRNTGDATAPTLAKAPRRKKSADVEAWDPVDFDPAAPIS